MLGMLEWRVEGGWKGGHVDGCTQACMHAEMQT